LTGIEINRFFKENTTMKTKHSLLILAGFASATALAQTRIENAPTLPERSEEVQVRVIEAQTENGTTYVCGGIGANEAEAMKRVASEFDLMLTFAASNGAYLADVNVDVADARGKPMLNTTCGGPIMLVDFDKGGKYRVRAEAGQHIVTRTVQVRDGGKVKNVAMSWPVKTVDMRLTPTQQAAQLSGSSGASTMGGRGNDGTTMNERRASEGGNPSGTARGQ
jgi:hypothetical protein